MVLCLIILLHAQLVQGCNNSFQGRSKSLTNLDAIGVSANDDMESSSETDNDMLDVPNSARRRRRKLSSAGKVSGSEFFTAVFEVWGDEWEDLVPAVRGTCLREAISGVCERRGVDIDSIDVFLAKNKTPLPLLTSETSWLGGRTLKIRGETVFKFNDMINDLQNIQARMSLGPQSGEEEGAPLLLRPAEKHLR